MTNAQREVLEFIRHVEEDKGFDLVFIKRRSVAEALVRNGLAKRVREWCVPEDSRTGNEVMRTGYAITLAGTDALDPKEPTHG